MSIFRRSATSLQDSSAEKLIERLRLEEEVLEALVDSSIMAIVVLDLEGRIFGANAQAEKVLGLTRKDLETRHYNSPEWQVADFEGRPIADNDMPFRRVIATGEALRDARLAIVWPSGERRYLSVHGAPLRDLDERRATDDHPLRGAIFAMEDVTEKVLWDARRSRYIETILAAEEAERRRLARGLHDGLGQTLTSLAVQLESSLMTGELTGSAALATLGRTLDHALDELRQLSRALHPHTLENLGLEVALGRLAEELGEHDGLTVDLHLRMGTHPWPAALEMAVFRIVQDALQSVVRHDGANRASVILEHLDETVRVIIEDDGEGFDPAATQTPTIELHAVRERVALFKGNLEIDSTPGAGTISIIQIPLLHPARESLENTP